MKLYKFRSLDNIEFVLDILLNERLYCAPYSDLNDPLEGLFYTIYSPNIYSKKRLRRYREIQDLPTKYSDIKICSLSEELNDIRMWSHYASGHTGVAIEIDFTNNNQDLKKVTYDPGLQKHSDSLLFESTPKEILSFKTEHWDYEQEYRILQDIDYYDISGRITGIYFGVRTSDFHRELLSKAVHNKYELINTRLDRKNIKIRPKS